MDALTLAETDETPAVVLDSKKGTFEITGRSIPLNAAEFYAPLIDWMQRYAQDPNPATHMTVRLEYFNTASAKQILDLLYALEKIKGASVGWYFDEDDEDMEEAGQEFAELVRIPFEFRTN
jgi:hypothetical protein